MLLQAQPARTIVAPNPSAPTSSTPSATNRHPVARNRLPLYPRKPTFSWPLLTSGCDPQRKSLLPAGAIAGWDLHPLKNAALARRTPTADIWEFHQQTSLNRKKVILEHSPGDRSLSCRPCAEGCGCARAPRAKFLNGAKNRSGKTNKLPWSGLIT